MCGVDRIDGEEKLINRLTRESRENCGCSCDGVCLPDVCECAAAGIQCQVCCYFFVFHRFPRASKRSSI